MATANERKALWFLAVVALSGSGVRLWRASTPADVAADTAGLSRQLARADSARDASQRRRAAAPPKPAAAVAPGPTQPVDVDHADSAQLERLPGIGPALARAIVANRDSLGAFGELSALCDVRGIGPALAEKLRPLVTFTGPRRPVSDGCGGGSTNARKSSAARVGQLR